MKRLFATLKRMRYEIQFARSELTYEEYQARKLDYPGELEFTDHPDVSVTYVLDRDGKPRFPQRRRVSADGEVTQYFRQLFPHEIILIWNVSEDPTAEGLYAICAFEQGGRQHRLSNTMSAFSLGDEYGSFWRHYLSESQLDTMGSLHQELLAFAGEQRQGGWLGLLMHAQIEYRKSRV